MINKAVIYILKFKTKWNNDIVTNGQNTIFSACLYYQSKIKYEKNFNKIAKYNEVDCKIIFEIITFLRKHYHNKK